MSCSGLALWLKRLTEINMFLCRGFSTRKKKCAASAESSRQENGEKNCFQSNSFPNVQWGSFFSKEEMPICQDGIISREANTYSLPETLAGREPFLPSLPAAAHTCSEAARPVRREARAACKARIHHFRPGSTRSRSKSCACMDKERPLLFCFPFSDLLLTAEEF